MLEIFIFGVLAIFLILPIIIIATENSGKRADRQTYSIAYVAFIIFHVFARYAIQLQIPRAVSFVLVAISVALLIWLFRSTVQRIRDMGRPKAVAYIAAIPIIGLLFQ